MLTQILNTKRIYKKIILISIDISIVLISLWLSFSLRLNQIYIPKNLEYIYFFNCLILSLLIFWRLGLYNLILRHVEFYAFKKIFYINFYLVTIWYFISGFIITNYFNILIPTIPRSIPIIFFTISTLMLFGNRIIIRALIHKVLNRKIDKYTNQVFIYGTSNSAVNLANHFKIESKLNIIGFLDDDYEKIDQTIIGYKIFGNINYVINNKEKFNNFDVIICNTDISREKRIEISEKLINANINVRLAPSLEQILNRDFQNAYNFSIDELLGRKSINPNIGLLQETVKDKIVFITGAGGSIGSEIAKQISKLSPKHIILLDHSEYNLFEIKNQLSKIKSYDYKVDCILGSIKNYSLLENIFIKNDIDIVYHAAAYKHVNMLEDENLLECLNNNFIGTFNLTSLALKYKTKNFILISTDKAVNPSSIMGASKRLAELVLQGFSKNQLLQGLNLPNKTVFSIVRFGNVLGSSGSVIPIFKKQIMNGGPVTVTHPKTTRYFMTIEEASQLVIQSTTMGKGGEVFVLDMGKPVNINKLAKRMISLYGLNIKSNHSIKDYFNDIEIVYTGLKPGEKLHEELLIGNNLMGTSHPKIIKANEVSYEYEHIQEIIKNIKNFIDNQETDKARLYLSEHLFPDSMQRFANSNESLIEKNTTKLKLV